MLEVQIANAQPTLWRIVNVEKYRKFIFSPYPRDQANIKHYPPPPLGQELFRDLKFFRRSVPLRIFSENNM